MESGSTADTSLQSAASLRRSKLLTSLSMNDIDMVGAEPDDQAADEDALGGENGAAAAGAATAETSLTRTDSFYSLCDIDAPVVVQVEADDPPTAAAAVPVGDDAAEVSFQVRLVSRNPSQRHADSNGGRKKSFHRSRTAVLQRFQQRSDHWNQQQQQQQQQQQTGEAASRTASRHHVVSIAALKAALSQPSTSYLDNGDLYPTANNKKTVFVSEYI